MNTRISELHKQLIQSHRALSKRLGKTADQQDAEAILREMEELNFRVMMVGRLLFKETTEAMDSRIETVIAAAADVDKSIAEIEKITEVVKTIGKFLGLVDKVLDAIKLT